MNYQTGAVVWGIEADFDAIHSESFDWLRGLGGNQPDAVGRNAPRSLRRRLRPAPRLCDGGRRSRELKSSFAIPTGPTSTTVTYGTWTAGGGLEYGITDNLSARVEYLYFDTGNVDTGSIGPPTTAIAAA